MKQNPAIQKSFTISSAEFVISSDNVSNCPKPIIPEYAFIGRSNVGKSSLINMLTLKKKLAKTSSTPGKTQLINHFLINNEFYLADLPGLGYACTTSKINRKKWEQFIIKYLTIRENLMCTFLLIDSRHKPLNNDIDIINWIIKSNNEFAIIFTKVDKLTKNELRKNLKVYETFLKQNYNYFPTIFLSSNITSLGRNEVLNYINDCNKMFKQG